MCDFGKVCLSARTALHKAMGFLLILHLLTPIDANKAENCWEYKVGNNTNIVNFVCKKLESSATDTDARTKTV